MPKGEARMMQYDGACDGFVSGDDGITSMKQIALGTRAVSESQIFNLHDLPAKPVTTEIPKTEGVFKRPISDLRIAPDISIFSLLQHNMELSPERNTAKPILSTKENDSPAAEFVVTKVSKVHFKKSDNNKPKHDLSENRTTLKELQRDPHVKTADLRAFSQSLKLTTPVPKDLEKMLSNDAKKQMEIGEKSDLDIGGQILEK